MRAYLAITAVLGLAVGMLNRSTIALGIIVIVMLVFPALSQNLPTTVANFFARFWPSIAGSHILTVTPDPTSIDDPTGDPRNGFHSSWQ